MFFYMCLVDVIVKFHHIRKITVKPLCKVRFKVIHSSCQYLLVQIHHLSGRSLCKEFPLIKKYYLVTIFYYTSHIMGYHKYGCTCLSYLFHSPVTLGLEENVSYGKRLIHYQYFRFHIDCKCKGKSYKHT